MVMSPVNLLVPSRAEEALPPFIETDTEELLCLHEQGHQGPCFYLDSRDKVRIWQWP